jgi:hypothetical protein
VDAIAVVDGDLVLRALGVFARPDGSIAQAKDGVDETAFPVQGERVRLSRHEESDGGEGGGKRDDKGAAVAGSGQLVVT